GILEREIAVWEGPAAHEIRVMHVDRDVREPALLEPGDEHVEREPEQGGGDRHRNPVRSLPSHSTSNSSATAGLSPISSGIPPRSGSRSPNEMSPKRSCASLEIQ